MFGIATKEDVIKNLERQDEINKELTSRLTALEKLPSISQLSDIRAELDALKMWKAQIMELAIGHTPTGRQNLNKLGRKMFGGKSKGMI